MKKEIRFQCWIDIDGEKFFGPGPARLLELIDKEGSISKAAKQMGMSYKKAWDIIDHLNSRGLNPYVISRKGGKKGGGAELTGNGKKVIQKYRSLMDKLNSVTRKEVTLLKLV